MSETADGTPYRIVRHTMRLFFTLSRVVKGKTIAEPLLPGWWLKMWEEVSLLCQKVHVDRLHHVFEEFVQRLVVVSF